MNKKIITQNTKLEGVILIKPVKHKDMRGTFYETYSNRTYKKILRIKHGFVQDNCSISHEGVLRGLHFQEKYKQGKLVRVTQGSVYDVVVDIRKGSKTFGKWQGFKINSKNMHQIYIPPGLAHGFLSLSDNTIFEYKCSRYYHPNSEKSILWNDPYLKIKWPINNPTISEKDKKGIYMSHFLKND